MERSRMLFFLFVLLLGACAQSKLAPEKYAQWVKEESNGLQSTKEMSDYKFSLQYRPVDYIALLEIKNTNKPFSEFNKIKVELSGMHYFTFRIASADPQIRVLDIGNTSEQDINPKLNYFSFDMQHNLQLIDGNDTLQCSLYNFERNYELAPYLDFSVAFARKSKNNSDPESLRFIYNGEALGVGIIQFEYDDKRLRSLPQLALPE
ncbi:MAG: hypothetical protein M3R17_11575 [Bacteroidota bacterium]|nr:hypothetical protein [Bacteroidota bacterium]